MMDTFIPITEKTHPIESKWLVKNFILTNIQILFYCFFYVTLQKLKLVGDYKLPVIIIFILINLMQITIIFLKINFQYEFGEKLITLRQGIISKSQRHVQYGRIQNITMTQGLTDRLLSMTSINIETASDSGGARLLNQDKQPISYFQIFFLGFSKGNFILIPGLSYKNALNLKETLTQLIKMNPIDDAQSGL